MSPEMTDHPVHDGRVEIIDQAVEYSFRDLFRAVKARLQFQLFDGRMSPVITRVNFERAESVGILLYDPAANAVLLTRQFRYSVYASLEPDMGPEREARKAWQLEIVAGVIDPGTSPVEAAHKEVLEEAGYVVHGNLRPIASIYPSPGWTSERIHLYLGLVDHRDPSAAGGGNLSEGEDIRIERIAFNESLLMIDRGEISDAKTIIALQHLAFLKS